MESKTPTSVNKSKAFKLPPQGFSPLVATEKELLIYGYPPRPDAKVNPEQAKLWEGVFSKNPTMIAPEIKTIELKEASNTYHPDTTENSIQNAGAILYPNGSFVSIQGEWNIPTCTPTNADNANGSNYALNTYLILHAQPSLVKFGVISAPIILSIGGNTYDIQISLAYYNVGNSMNFVQNFPVSAGQTIHAFMCYNYTTKIMSFWLLNVTANVLMPMPMNVSTDLTSTFAIGWGVDSNAIYGVGLPNFSPITFQYANADIKNAQGIVNIVGADTGTLLNLTDLHNNVLAATTILSPTTNSISVKYAGRN